MAGIKEARESLGLTRKDMVEGIGIPYRTIQNWEGGINRPQPWVERLVIAEMERIAEKKKDAPG